MELDIKTLGIDQSINGTGLCLLNAGRKEVCETLTFDKSDGMNRLVKITERIVQLTTEHSPSIVVMEDYASCARSSSLVPLVELGGCIKLALFRQEYEEGREALLRGDKVLMIQNQSNMKKFMLGSGATKVDTRYLLTVMERVKVAFPDDNQADAYMHAWQASITAAVLRGKVPIGNLPAHQQEALMSGGIKVTKGMTATKAMKLSDVEKLKLVGWY